VTNYYLSREGRQLGPFSEQELRVMLASSQAMATDLACVVGETEWKPLHTFPGFGGRPASPEPPVSGLIPYKNPPALIGYYLGVFAMIPCIGLVFGIPALICGIIGLKKAKQSPVSKGKGHAWTAIILGSLAILLWGAAGVAFLISLGKQH